MGSTLGRFENPQHRRFEDLSDQFSKYFDGRYDGGASRTLSTGASRTSAQALREHQYILLRGSISYSGMP